MTRNEAAFGTLDFSAAVQNAAAKVRDSMGMREMTARLAYLHSIGKVIAEYPSPVCRQKIMISC